MSVKLSTIFCAMASSVTHYDHYSQYFSEVAVSSNVHASGVVELGLLHLHQLLAFQSSLTRIGFELVVASRAVTHGSIRFFPETRKSRI